MDIQVIQDLHFPGGVNYFYLPKYSVLIDVGTGKMDYSNVQKLDVILLTHGHPDHVNGIYDLVQKFKCRVMMHEHDDFMVPFEFEKLDCAVEINGLKLQVIPTPGHSPGGVCFYEPIEKILFSGDTVFSNGVVGRWDLAGSSFEQLHESIKKLFELDIKKIYPGHGPIVEINGNEHIKMALQRMEEYSKRI